MSRQLVFLFISALVLAGLVGAATKDKKDDDNDPKLRLSTMDVGGGKAIKITFGESSFMVPEFTFLTEDGKPAGTVKIKDGQMEVSDTQTGTTFGFSQLTLNGRFFLKSSDQGSR